MYSRAYNASTAAIDSANSTVSPWESHQKELVKTPEGCVVLTAKPGAFIPWDNPDNFISQDLEKAFDSTVAVVILPVLFLISTPTNTINMIVFWKHGLKQRINLCLFCLSIVDFSSMLFTAVYNFEAISSYFTKSKQFGPIFEFLISSYLGVFRGLNWVSNSITTLISCERCFCVISPLRSQTIFRARTTGMFIVLSSLVLLGVLFITTTRWSIVCVFDPVANSTSKTLYSSQFYLENKQFVDVVTGVVVLLVLPVYFVSVVLVTTVVTIVKLRHVVKWREQASSASMSTREVALTRTLIGTSVLFLICTAPTLVFGFCILIVPDVSLHGRYSNTFKSAITLLELCMYINSSTNFFIYCKMSSRYRETLREMFRCSKVQDKSDVISKTDSTVLGTA